MIYPSLSPAAAAQEVLSLNLSDQRLERFGLIHGEIGENLAVQIDTGSLKLIDEYGVAHSFLADGGVDPHDPQAAVVALLQLAANILITETFLEYVLGYCVYILPLAIKTFGLLQYLFPPGAGCNRIDGTWHIT